jgi:hypothetical protein
MEIPDMGDVNKHIDKATQRPRETWWRSLSSDEQLAWGALFAAGGIGPLGMSFMAAFGTLYSGKVPSADQFEAVLLLTVLTAPVFLGLTALIALARYGAMAFLWAGLAATAGGYVTSSVGPATSLGNFYCYRSLTTLEHACRAFDQAGFQIAVGASGGGPTGGARILGFAFVYTADARGAIMALCGVVAGCAAGYLIRMYSQQA